jgi:hypothetical protein
LQRTLGADRPDLSSVAVMRLGAGYDGTLGVDQECGRDQHSCCRE